MDPAGPSAFAEVVNVDLRDAPQGDRPLDIPVSTAPRTASGTDPRTPASDSGSGAGRRLDAAFRRDRSTLRARVTDGALVYQPARTRTASRASSPQAVRREPVTGTGDSTRTSQPRPGAPDVEVPGQGAVPEAPPLPGEQGARAPNRADSAAGAVGRLDSDQGARSFDVERVGTASDNTHSRAASNAAQPGRVDFSEAASPGPSWSAEGRGPGQAPGAADRVTRGEAPALLGTPRDGDPGADLAVRAQDRRYQRYVQEIMRRVGTEVSFPKTLELQLQQGETIVRFVVRPDGRVTDGVHVVKSSGFDEFDEAAVRAVRKAAPFPPLPAALARGLAVSARIPFENPLIR